MELISAAEKKEQLKDEDYDPFYEQIKRKLTKRINNALAIPFEFTHPLLAQHLQFSSSIDSWLEKYGYRCRVSSNIIHIGYK